MKHKAVEHVRDALLASNRLGLDRAAAEEEAISIVGRLIAVGLLKADRKK